MIEYARVQIEDNLQILFTPKYVDYQVSKKGYGDQIRVKSEEGQLLYLPLDTAAALTEAQVLAPNGVDRDWQPAWRVARRAQVGYTKRSKGKPPLLTVGGILFTPSIWKEVVPTSPAGNGGSAGSGGSPSSPPTDDVLDPWMILEATMAKMADIALHIWTDPRRLAQLKAVGITVTFEGITAQAATGMISAEKKGIRAIPPAPISDFHTMPAALREESEP